MKKYYTVLMLTFIWNVGHAQPNWQLIRDSIGYMARTATSDTTRLKYLLAVSINYQFSVPDSSIFYSKNALDLARKLNLMQQQVTALRVMALANKQIQNDLIALQLNLKALKLAEANGFSFDESLTLMQIGLVYESATQYDRAIELLRKGQNILDVSGALGFAVHARSRVIKSFLLANQLDSAKFYGKMALENFPTHPEHRWAEPYLYAALGELQYRLGNPDSAMWCYRKSLASPFATDLAKKPTKILLARIFLEDNKRDSSLFFARQVLELSLNRKIYADIADSYQLFSQIYEGLDAEQALINSQLAHNYRDSLSYLSKRIALNTFLDFDEQERQRDSEQARLDFENRIRTNAILGTTFTLIVIAFFLYRNNRVKSKSKIKVERAYEELKSTQSQLIQSEKMASLGELTAGIAHEIQNPLNFVNNFSDVNKELLTEIDENIEKGNFGEVKAIIKDVINNEEKIRHHGKRADAIVKGMLQHSRSSSGQKEPTDINALCDEYLRLSYHGYRAKDKSFNAKFETNFDSSLPKINVVPQDIGRVILNLINNAFYAVNEKLKNKNGNYEPLVKVTTKNLGNKIEISVKDNGNGIPDSIKEKIFQPFFTTKPTGQGTGLGLSLAYDIVTKGHGGAIEVESSISQGSNFNIQIPLSR